MNNTFVPEKSVISYGSSLPDQELISAAFPSEFIIKFWTVRRKKSSAYHITGDSHIHIWSRISLNIMLYSAGSAFLNAGLQATIENLPYLKNHCLISD